ncbi:MAG: phosphate regulon sensor histidine kinase PhoR [Woeseiaceae bacterium]|nr:phosphate regulon sensor histidine kinase PhoR [Woeseiaceae bacterium]
MSGTPQKFILSLAMLLTGGALIGWIYGSAERGFMIAALISLIWNVRHLLAFVTAIRTGNFDLFRDGDGIWQQIYSRFNYERERADRYKSRHRQLLKEVRKSTDAMPDGALILDENNEILICNRAAKALAGLKPKKDRGRRVDNILRDPGLAKLLRSNNYAHEIEMPSPVQEKQWLSCRLVPYGANQKLLFIRDVTERMQMSKMRRDFVANASHELRSPLTVISGYLDTLADDANVPAEWAQPMAQMKVQANRMNTIVAELLELSRLENAGMADFESIVDVADIIKTTSKRFESSNPSINLACKIDKNVRLKGSGSEIESLVTNLLSNAYRHVAEDGNIKIAWFSDSGGASLIVEDDGIGIDPEHLPRLTERFFRVDRGRSRDAGGIGLGLAIVKHILSRHAATLDIVSEPGTGSRFQCRFTAQRVVT